MNELPETPIDLPRTQRWYQRPKVKWSALAGTVILILFGWRCGKTASADLGIARAAVEHFHQQFNAGDFDGIYLGANEQYRTAITQAQSSQFLSAVQRKLGNFVRTGKPAFFVNATTHGTFVTLIYQTDFAEGKGQERFVFDMHGTEATLVGYNVNSRDLVVK